MYKHSILFKLNILFSIALITTIIATFSIVGHIAKRDQADLLFKSRIILKEIRENRATPIALLQEFNLKEVPKQSIREIVQKAKPHPLRKTPPHRPQKQYHILHYQGSVYLHINTRYKKLLLQEKRTFWDRFTLPIFIFIGIISLLIVMYILLRESLKPIKRLEKEMIAYGEGKFPTYQLSDKKDEISLVSNAFYQAIEKSRTLVASRKLFLRNIFHELNTPITKGKILAEIVKDKPTKTMLDSIFTRLSTLLQELAQMEEITSGDYRLNLKEVRIIELIDQARDWLYIDDEIETNISYETITVDFHLMSIVFKNLIDNGEKYGTNLKIIYNKKTISFISKGEKLEHKLSYYTQAFTKAKQTNKGFGLGLYIIDEVLQKHQMHLEYDYVNGYSIFRVFTRS